MGRLANGVQGPASYADKPEPTRKDEDAEDNKKESLDVSAILGRSWMRYVTQTSHQVIANCCETRQLVQVSVALLAYWVA